jgi:hypothetical protein
VLSAQDWWDADEDVVGPRLFETVSGLESGSSSRRYANLIYNRLATGRDLPNVYGLSMARRQYGGLSGALSEFVPPSINVCGPAVETLAARVGRNRPWITFQTTGANWKTRRRAKLLSKFIDGLFYEAGVWSLLPDVFRDMLVFCDGVGALKVFERGGRIVVERVIPEELLVDDADAVRGCPRTLYQRTFASKAALIAQHPDKEDEIRAAGGAFAGLGWSGGANVPEQFAPICDGWHLPDGAEGEEGYKPGRHVFTVGDKVIADEKWTRPAFPFAFLRGYPLGAGFWRQGVVEQLLPYQAKLDRNERVIDECHRRLAAPKWFVEAGSKVDAQHLIAKVASVVKYHGTVPQLPTYAVVPPELYAEREKWIRMAFERVGVSQMAAAGVKPAGLNSGEAQRVYADITEGRHVTLALALEACVVELAERMLELAVELQPRVRSPGRRGVQLIDWSAAKLDPDGFIMQAFPISSLPATPAGRLQRSNELLQMGVIDREQYARLLENPDTQAATDPIEAAKDCIEWMLDQIVEGGDYESPEPYMPLDTALQMAIARYLRVRSEGAPDEVLSDLARWLEEVRELQAAAQPQAAVPAPGVQQVPAGEALPAPAQVPEYAAAA